MLEEAFLAGSTHIYVYLRACRPTLLGAWRDSGGVGTAPLRVSSSSEFHAAQASLHGRAPGAASPPHLELMPQHQRDRLPPLGPHC